MPYRCFTYEKNFALSLPTLKCSLCNFENGLKSGYGIVEWSDGSKYEGHWYEDNKNGEGTYKWADGR